MDEKNPTVPKPPSVPKQRGAIGYIFLWLLGIPIPVLIVIALLRGCS
jgi:hypothetical protein